MTCTVAPLVAGAIFTAWGASTLAGVPWLEERRPAGLIQLGFGLAFCLASFVC